MVVRKNIALEEEHLKKIYPLLQTEGGNLSAAIRDAIDLTDLAIRRYNTIEKSKEALLAKEKELTPREQTIESGKNVLVSYPEFLWLLKWTKGFLLNRETIEEIFDPLTIRSISELDKKANEICKMFGWQTEVSIYCMDDLNPATATVIVSNGSSLVREFIAHHIALFLLHQNKLDIDNVHKRASAIRIDFKKMNANEKPVGIKNFFGFNEEIAEEITNKKDFWLPLIAILKSINYNAVVINKDHYEALLAGRNVTDTSIFEAIDRKHISDIPLPDFFQRIKYVHEAMRIADRVDISENVLSIYHSFKEEPAIIALKNYYIALLKENGHEFDAKYSSSIIVLTHMCCK